MAKVDFYGYMGFVDFMAEREKSQRSAMHMAKVDFMAIWCGFRGFYRCGLLSFSFRAFPFLISICVPFWRVPFFR